MLEVTGKTTDGKTTVKGVFHVYASQGVPFEAIFLFLHEKNMIPSWLDFFKEALENGWSLATINDRVLPAAVDVFGKDIEKPMKFFIMYYEEYVERIESKK